MRHLLLVALAAWSGGATSARGDTLSDETGTDAPVIGPAQSYPWHSTISAGTEGAVVAWEDYRVGYFSLFAARIGVRGDLLDPVGLPVAVGARPSAAFDGTRHWLAWLDNTHGRGEVVVTRLSAAATPLDDLPTRVHDAWNASFACRPDGCLVAWLDEVAAPATGSRVGVSRLGTDGALLDPAGIEVAPAGARRANVSVAPFADGYLLAWSQCPSSTPVCDLHGRSPPSDGDVYALRVTASGSVLDAAPIAVATEAAPQRAPVVAGNDSTGLVAWQEDESAYIRHVRLRRLSAAGDVIDVASILVPSLATSQASPTAAWAGAEFWVGAIGSAAEVTRVPAAGDPSRAASVPCGPRPAELRLAAAGSAVWGACGSPYHGLFAGPLGGPSSPWPRVTQSANRQLSPVVAFDGENYLVVWSDYRAPPYLGIVFESSLYATRVARDGRVLDDPAIALGVTGRASVAFDGRAFVIVTAPSRLLPRLVGLRVRRDGTVTDPTPALNIEAPPPPPPVDPDVDVGSMWASDPKVASTGAGSLVVWSWNNGDRGVTLAQRLDAEGRPDGEPIVLAELSTTPFVAAAGDRYAVVWNEGTVASGALVDASGATPIAPVFSGYVVDLAGGNGEFLVLHTHGADRTGVRAAFLSGGGAVVLDDLVVEDDEVPPTADSLAWLARGAWDGRSFVVATVRGASHDVTATRLSADGVIASRTPIARAGHAYWDAPAVASDEHGATLVEYGRFDPAPPFGEVRARGRVLRADLPDAGTGPPDAASDAGAMDATLAAPDTGSAPMPRDAGLRAAPAGGGGCGCNAARGRGDCPAPAALLGALLSAAWFRRARASVRRIAPKDLPGAAS